jgi:hypothetical protein
MTNQTQTARTTSTQLFASPDITAHPHENKTLAKSSGSFGRIALHRNPPLSGSFGRILLPPNLNQTRALATLSLYVSPLRRPAASPSSSGDHYAAGPGLKRFSKSNERTPAAVPAGFFIASGPSCRQYNSGKSK